MHFPLALAIGCNKTFTQGAFPCNLGVSIPDGGYSGWYGIGRVFTMNEEEQVELLSGVDILESLYPKRR